MELLILFSFVTLTLSAPSYYSQPGSANMDSPTWPNYNSGNYQQNRLGSQSQPGSANMDSSAWSNSATQNRFGNQNQGYNILQYNDPYYHGSSTNNYIDSIHDPNEGMSSNFEQQQYFQQEQRNQAQQTDGLLSQVYNNLINGGGNSLFGSLSLDEISKNILEALSSRISNNN